MQHNNCKNLKTKFKSLFIAANLATSIILSGCQRLNAQNEIEHHINLNEHPSNKKPRKGDGIGAGIENIGNSCYMNAALQILSNLYPTVLNYKPHKKEILLKEILKLKEKLESNQRVTKQEAISFYNTLASNEGIGWKPIIGTQQDASELLSNLLFDFNIAGLRFKTILENPSKQKEKQIPDSKKQLPIFNIHMFHLQENRTMQDYFDIEMAPETINDVKWDNDDPTLFMDIKKSDLIANSIRELRNKPLAMQILRYNYNSTIQKASKINIRVKKPFDLLIRKNLLADSTATQAINYKLVGFIEHIGHHIDSGHYVAYIKKNNQWFGYNDSTVYPLTDSDAEAKAELAYIYIYQPIK